MDWMCRAVSWSSQESWVAKSCGGLEFRLLTNCMILLLFSWALWLGMVFLTTVSHWAFLLTSKMLLQSILYLRPLGPPELFLCVLHSLRQNLFCWNSFFQSSTYESLCPAGEKEMIHCHSVGALGRTGFLRQGLVSGAWHPQIYPEHKL
jgi:hypothetical protein